MTEHDPILNGDRYTAIRRVLAAAPKPLDINTYLLAQAVLVLIDIHNALCEPVADQD